jgi:hypothetical protein
MSQSDFVVIFIGSTGSLIPPAVQGIQADGVRVAPGWHVDGLSGRLVVLEEFSELLLANLDTLAVRGIAHLHHGSQEVETVRNIGTSAKKDEKNEEHRVAENYPQR